MIRCLVNKVSGEGKLKERRQGRLERITRYEEACGRAAMGGDTVAVELAVGVRGAQDMVTSGFQGDA